jgi:hypothetical protein
MKLIKPKKYLLVLLGLIFCFFSSPKQLLAKDLKEVTLGAYLTSLYDINSDRGTFSADMWIWSKAKLKDKYDLSKTLEVSYISSQVPHVYSGLSRDKVSTDTQYTQKKLQGTFLHDFNLENFPFDRQKLKIYFEDSEFNQADLKFFPDSATGADEDIKIDGWKIEKVSLVQGVKEYKTNFGNFTKADKDTYSRLEFEIEIKRDAPLIFFKITLGLFAAVLVAMFSTFMPTESDDIFSARIGLLGGTLLAVVVNQQFADSKTGETTSVTLIDSLHMLGFSTVFVLFIATILSRMLCDRYNQAKLARKFDHFSFGIAAIIFATISIKIISDAISS